MSATIWMTVGSQRAHWLLTDGSILVDPILEESSSQRRVRLYGDKKSHPHHMRNEIQRNALVKQLDARGAQVLCQVHPDQPDGAGPAFAAPLPEPVLRMLDNPSANHWQPGSASRFVWHYVCREAPQVQAHVEVSSSDLRPETGTGARRILHTRISGTPLLVSMRSNWRHGGTAHGLDDRFTQALSQVEPITGFGTLVKRLEPDDGFEPLLAQARSEEFLHDDHGLLKALLARLRYWSNVDEFCVPNFARLADPKHNSEEPLVWTMQLKRTTVTTDVLDGLAAVLETRGAGIAVVMERFRDFQTSLREQLGLVTGDIKASDLARLLMGKDAEVITTIDAPVANVSAYMDAAPDSFEAIPFDAAHTLGINLVDGTFTVACRAPALANGNLLNAAGAEWEQAKAIASITGEESQLIGLAHAIAERREEAHRTAVQTLYRNEKKQQ